MRLVIIESPYKSSALSSLEQNQRYLRSCIRDCINRDESPYASHCMLTDALDDNNPVERAVGIKAGLAWRHVTYHVFYVDLGYSDGMILAKHRYDVEGIHYEERKLPVDDPFFLGEP